MYGWRGKIGLLVPSVNTVAEPEFKSAMDKLETPIAFKQGEEFQRFFDADARRLAAGVRKVGRIEEKK